MGNGQAVLNGLHDFNEFTLCWWQLRDARSHSLNTTAGAAAMMYVQGAASDAVHLRTLFGQAWGKVYFVQFLTAEPEVVDLAQHQMPEVPHLGARRVLLRVTPIGGPCSGRLLGLHGEVSRGCTSYVAGARGSLVVASFCVLPLGRE